MLTLESLPKELMLAIFDLFGSRPATRDGTTALQALCLTSRAVGDAATTILYRQITSDTGKSSHRLPKLIRTLVAQPQFAQAIKFYSGAVKVYDEINPTPEKGRTKDHSELLGNVARYLVERIPASPQVTGHVLHTISSGALDVGLTAVLILLAWNLKYFRFSLWNNHYQRAMRRNAIHELFGKDIMATIASDLKVITGCFDGLQKLSIPVGHFEMVSFFDLPNLNTLDVDLSQDPWKNCRVETPTAPIPASKYLPRIRKLCFVTHTTELELDWPRTYRGPNIIPRIFSALCPSSSSDFPNNKIKSVEICLLPRRRTRRTPQYSLCPIMPSLLPIKSTLTELTVTWPIYSRFARTVWHLHPYVNDFPAMEHFQSLRRLELPQDLLIHRGFRRPPHPLTDLSRLLPGTIRELDILCPDGMLLPWLQQFHQQLGSFPCFKVLKLGCLPQHGRSARWFVRRKAPVFKVLRSAHIIIKIFDAGRIPWRGSIHGSKGVDIFDHCNKCPEFICTCIQNLFEGSGSDAQVEIEDSEH